MTYCRLVSLVMLAWVITFARPLAPVCQAAQAETSKPKSTQPCCPNGSQKLEFYGGPHDYFGTSPNNVLHSGTICVRIHNPNPFKTRYRATFANTTTPAQLLLQGPSAAENALVSVFFPTSAMTKPSTQAAQPSKSSTLNAKILEGLEQLAAIVKPPTTGPCTDPKVSATEETLKRRLAGASDEAHKLRESLKSQDAAFGAARTDLINALSSIKKAATELLAIESNPGEDAKTKIANLQNSLGNLSDPTESYNALESTRAANHAKSTTYLNDLQKTIADMGTLLDNFNSSNPALAACLRYDSQDVNEKVGDLHAQVLEESAESQMVDEQVAKIEEGYNAWKSNHDAYLQALGWARDGADQFTTIDVLSGNSLPAGHTVTVTILRRDLAAPSPVPPPPKPPPQGQQDSPETTAGTLSFDVLQPSHYGVVVGITVTTVSDPTFGSTTRAIPATSDKPQQQQITIFRQTGDSQFRPMPTLFLTPYLFPHFDFAKKVSSGAPGYLPVYKRYIPYPAFGLSLSSIKDNYFLGGGEDIATGVAILFGAHFGNVHTLLGQFNGVPIKENTAFTVPSSDNFNLQNVVVMRWHTGFFFSISIDAASLKHILGG